MNNPDLRAAAKAILRAEPEIARHFGEADIEEILRILAKRLRIAGAMIQQESE